MSLHSSTSMRLLAFETCQLSQPETLAYQRHDTMLSFFRRMLLTCRTQTYVPRTASSPRKRTRRVAQQVAQDQDL